MTHLQIFMFTLRMLGTAERAPDESKVRISVSPMHFAEVRTLRTLDEVTGANPAPGKNTNNGMAVGGALLQVGPQTQLGEMPVPLRDLCPIEVYDVHYLHLCTVRYRLVVAVEKLYDQTPECPIEEAWLPGQLVISLSYGGDARCLWVKVDSTPIHQIPGIQGRTMAQLRNGYDCIASPRYGTAALDGCVGVHVGKRWYGQGWYRRGFGWKAGWYCMLKNDMAV